MALEIFWHLENRLMRQRFFDNMTTEDIGNSAAAIVTAAQQVPQPRDFHVLCDLSEVTSMPLNMSQVQQAGAALKKTACGWLVMVLPNNPLVKPLVALATAFASQLFGLRFKHFASEQAALDFLASIDENIAQWQQKR